MTSDRRDSRINELFGQARVLGQDDQLRFLDDQCVSGEESIRQEVERLLSAYRDAPTSDFKNPLLPSSSLARGFDAVFNDPYLGQTLGPYRLKKHIATGGFGIIYLAVREADFQQKVAVKILRSEQHDREQLLRRFELERQLLADLEHEYIAHLISGGETPAGDPYFVMEYVEGEPITEYCDNNRLTIDQRLELFDKVCAAVTHAHQYGVIHRDLKPSNILVSTSGVPKLLDFGIAKLFDPILQKRMLSITQTAGVTPMTPLYASPEQVRSERVSTATDVYSLGVMLYEIVSGKNPHAITSTSAEEVRKAICDRQPTPPSTALSQFPEPTAEVPTNDVIDPHEISQRRKTDRRRLQRHLSGDLDNIILMALRKEPERRYASASELRDDIRRYRNGEPVRARKNTLLYTTKRLMSRHYVATAACGVALLALIAGSTIATLGWMNASAANLRAEEAASRWKLQLAIRQWERGEFLKLEETLNDDFGIAGKSNSAWENRYFQHLVRDLPDTLDVGKQITGMDYHSETNRMCLGHLDGTITIWQREPNWRMEKEWQAHPGEVLDVAWRPDAQIISSAGRDELIKLWKADTGALIAENELRVKRFPMDPSTHEVFLSYRRIAWHPQGDRFAVPSNTRVTIFSGENCERISDVDFDCPDATDAAWSPSGDRLAVGGLLEVPAEESFVVEKNIETGETRRVQIPGRTMSLDWTDSEDKVVVGIADFPGLKGRLGVCDFSSGEFRRISSASNDWTEVDWGSGEMGVAFGGADGFIRSTTFDLDSGEQKWQLHQGSIEKVVWDPHRRQIISADATGVVRCTDPRSITDSTIVQGFGRIAWSPDSKLFAATARSTGNDGETRVHLFDAFSGEVVQKLEPIPYGWISSLAWQRQDSYILGAIVDGRIIRWRRDDGKVEEVLSAKSPYCVATDPTGGLFAFADESDVVIRSFEAEGAEERFSLGTDEWIAGICWSHTGQFIATMCDSHRLKVWEVGRYSKEVLNTHVHSIESGGFGQLPLAWHPNKNQLATVDGLGRLAIWSIDKKVCEQLIVASGHTGPVWCVAWSPDGERIATGGIDAQVILWNASNLRKVLHFDQETAVGVVSWSPDGRFLVSEGGHEDGRFELRYAP